MENNDNITELFYAKLKQSTNPGVVLAQFYGSLFSVQVGKSEIIQLNRLIRMFGKTSVFFSLIDISRKDGFPEFPFGLLFKICKDKLEANLQAEITSASFDSLDRRIMDTRKEIEHIKKIDPGVADKLLGRKDK